jgi:hypothetical protein
MRFTVNFDPKNLSVKKPEFEVENFFIIPGSRIENLKEGYGLKISSMVCIRCERDIIQISACSNGTGSLVCQCSYWSSDISPFSGTAHVQGSLKHESIMSVEQKAEMLLRELTNDRDNIYQERKGFTPEVRRALKELL